MPHPATPLAAAAPVPSHGGAQGHAHGHGQADGHGHDDHGHHHAPGPAEDQAPVPPATLPASLLMAGAGSRLLATLGLLALLWAAVAWALGDTA